MFKLGIGNDLGSTLEVDYFGVQRSNVKVTRGINAHTVNAQYLPNGKAYELFKLGTQTEQEDPISDKSRDLQGQGRKVT